MCSDEVRLPSSDPSDLFLFEQKRRVHADRTVSLDGVAYEVDALLVGETVTLRYDPARPPDERRLQVWHSGKHVQLARRVDVYANCSRRDHATKTLHPRPRPLRSLPACVCVISTPRASSTHAPTPTTRKASFNVPNALCLTRHPFSKSVEPDQLFTSGVLRELEVRLHHLLELRGIGIVTGESGSGKTTACRKIVACLHTGLQRVCMFASPRAT